MVDSINNPFPAEPVIKGRSIGTGWSGSLMKPWSKSIPGKPRRQSKDDRGRHSQRTHDLRKAQVRYNAFRSSIARFEQFLSAARLEMVTVDEKLMVDFDRHLSDAGVPDHGHYRGRFAGSSTPCRPTSASVELPRW